MKNIARWLRVVVEGLMETVLSSLWLGEKTEQLMRVECEAAQLTWVLIGLNCHQIVAITEECKNINF